MNTLKRAATSFLFFSVLCGGVYTFAITGVSQLCFKEKANGSIIEVDGVKYGSLLLGQQYNDEDHMWGRIMNIDISTYKDKDGNVVAYASPSNLSPASEEYGELVKERINMIKEANPEMEDTAIPVDLVTCSGSGLDPHISPSAAYYQVPRLCDVRNISKDKMNSIIKECTTGKFLGLFGQETVNVLKVNLMLDGILK